MIAVFISLLYHRCYEEIDMRFVRLYFFSLLRWIHVVIEKNAFSVHTTFLIYSILRLNVWTKIGMKCGTNLWTLPQWIGLNNKFFDYIFFFHFIPSNRTHDENNDKSHFQFHFFPCFVFRFRNDIAIGIFPDSMPARPEITRKAYIQIDCKTEK